MVHVGTIAQENALQVHVQISVSQPSTDWDHENNVLAEIRLDRGNGSFLELLLTPEDIQRLTISLALDAGVSGHAIDTLSQMPDPLLLKFITDVLEARARKMTTITSD